MRSKKTANIVLSVLAAVLAVIAVVLIAFSAQSACVSSRYEPPSEEKTDDGIENKLPEGETNVKGDEDKTDEDELFPKGDLTQIWFDELFAVYYPKQLADVYPTRAVVYGDVSTKQAPFCFCSEKITDIEIFSVAGGKYEKELMKVEYLEPMEAIVLKVELSEEPDIGISFKDKNGKKYSYGIGRNADSSEVVLTKLAK